MLGELATMTGYVKAPRTTYVVKHPLKAMHMARVRRDIGDSFTPTRIGVGLAALIAIPLGIWLGRRFAESRRREDENL